MKSELRFYPSEDCELRFEDGEDGQTLVGSAPPYGVWSVDLGGFREKFERGAFVDGDVIATHEHDNARLLGRVSSGTLELFDDDKAARYRVKLPDTTVGRDVAALGKRGDLVGSSFEFMVMEGGERWEQDENGRTLRTVTKARRIQVGPVATPAYPETTAAVRSLNAWQEEQRGDTETGKQKRAREIELVEAELSV
jgi:HK97 family phage prohead protease